MKRVGAALGSYVDLSSRRSTYFGGIGAGLNLEFVNRVNRGRETETIAIQVHRFDAIVIIPVLRVTGAIGGHADGLSNRAAQTPNRNATRRARIDSGGQQRELHKGAAIERQV